MHSALQQHLARLFLNEVGEKMAECFRRRVLAICRPAGKGVGFENPLLLDESPPTQHIPSSAQSVCGDTRESGGARHEAEEPHPLCRDLSLSRHSSCTETAVELSPRCAEGASSCVYAKRRWLVCFFSKLVVERQKARSLIYGCAHAKASGVRRTSHFCCGDLKS